MSCGLARHCMPSGVDAKGLRQLDAAIRDKRPLSPGDALFHAGSPLQSLYIIRSGSLMSSVASENGEVQVIAFHLPGEVTGLDGLADHQHVCTMVALERSRVCELPLHAFEQVVAEVPQLKTWFLELIGQETIQDYAHMAMMGKRMAQERLASFLVSFSLRYQRLDRDPCALKLTMSRSDLASYLGLAEETVSRLFTRFQEQGLLEVRRKLVYIRDMDGLVEVCQGRSPEQAEKSRVSGA